MNIPGVLRLLADRWEAGDEAIVNTGTAYAESGEQLVVMSIRFDAELLLDHPEVARS